MSDRLDPVFCSTCLPCIRGCTELECVRAGVQQGHDYVTGRIPIRTVARCRGSLGCGGYTMDPTTAITVAGIGLVGVLIGGLITAGANFILAVRREWAEEAKEHRNDAREVARAARLVLQELISARSSAVGAAKTDNWRRMDIGIKTDAWQKYGPTIAVALTLHEWQEVEMAYRIISEIFGIAL